MNEIIVKAQHELFEIQIQTAPQHNCRFSFIQLPITQWRRFHSDKQNSLPTMSSLPKLAEQVHVHFHIVMIDKSKCRDITTPKSIDSGVIVGTVKSQNSEKFPWSSTADWFYCSSYVFGWLQLSSISLCWKMKCNRNLFELQCFPFRSMVSSNHTFAFHFHNRINFMDILLLFWHEDNEIGCCFLYIFRAID